MRKFLAIVVCKLGRFVGKLVGKGSSMPGKFALKICPDILRRVQLPPHIIAVTGSNGKTSTVEMIATVLRGQGKNVIYNAEGSNQVEGVTTLILTHATLGGKVNADVLLLESDERYAAHSFKYFHPTEFVITNLYRDQLTRNGHPESVFDAILPAIHPDTELILNGDDPLSSCFVIGHEKVKWFGLNRCATDTETPTGVYHDGAYCPVCHAPMEYEYVHYNHIGAYRCTSCGHARPDPDYAATELDLQNGKLILDGQFTVALAFRSIYNVYNILAAYAACRECGVEGAAIADTLSSYILKNGRMQTFTLGQHHGTLLTSKHENSIAYDTNLRYIASANEDCTVLIIVDAVSRKYFTSETSWLWDIDFDQLNVPHVKRVVLSGLYRNDLAERFSFTGVDLPGEAGSIIHKTENIKELDLAIMSFGQSFQITPLQLLRAVSAVVNGGKLVTPHFGVKKIDTEGNISVLEYEESGTIIKQSTTETMRGLLKNVVELGGGLNCRIEGYSIAGKTATSEKLPRGNGKYIASFIGIAPAENPQVIAMCIIDEPVGMHYGGVIAAPVVKSLFENILPYLGIEKGQT